jgi:protein-disulfide isomerase
MIMRGVLSAALAAVAITLWTPLPAFPQPADDLDSLKKDLETLTEGQTAIQRDLREIRRLLRARPAAAAPAPAPPPVPREIVLNLDGAPVKGEKTAKVTLVEFTDYQ